MFSLNGLGRKLALLLLIPMLSACVDGSTRGRPNGYYPPQRPWPGASAPGGPEYGRPRPGPGPGQQMCTMDYRPVCGERDGRLETFSNSCQAGQRGYRIVSAGECRQSGTYPPQSRPDWNQPGRPDRPDRPVRPDNARPDHNRPDRDRPDQAGRPDRPDGNQSGRPDRPGRPDASSGACTRDYRPVCGQNGARTQTFPNACEAASAGFSVVASGECRR